MVGVPTMLICLGLTLGASSQISAQEAVPLSMGPAQASVETTGGHRIAQAPQPDGGYLETEDEARAVPGFRSGATAELNSAAIADLTGGDVVPWTQGFARARVGERDLRLESLAVADPSRFTGKIALRSGRWPTRADEALVSPAAVRRGVPETGTLQLVQDGRQRRVTVVGTALASTAQGSSYDLVVTQHDLLTGPEVTSGWYVFAGQPVTWADVTRLNEYGLSVSSAHVARHPPAMGEVHPELRWTEAGSSDQTQLVVLGGTLLLITIALLVGPAFAVGATRQRRTLALAASNGATAGQLRRTVLAQAIVLGGVSAGVGALLSVPAAWLATRVVADRGSWMGPFEVPWAQLTAICAIAVLAAVLAALAPAQRLTRLDIVGAMRGRVVTPPPSRWLFALGLAVAGLGGAGVIVGLDRGEYVIALAAVLLVLGTLLLVPRVLHTVGRLAGPLPLPLRLAVRDLARHRARSAPTVAAVLAGSAALTMGVIGASSDNEQERQDYVPQTIAGEGFISTAGPVMTQDPLAGLEQSLPGLVATPIHAYGADEVGAPTEGGEAPAEPFVITLPRGCSVAEVVTPGATPSAPPEGDVEVTGPATDPCVDRSIGSGTVPTASTLGFMPGDEIIRRFALTGDDARRVRAGSGVLLTAHPEEVAPDGGVRVARGEATLDNATGTYRLAGTPDTDRFPVIVRPVTIDSMARSMQSSLLLPTERAEADGWPLRINSHALHSTHGAIDEETEERLQQRLGEEMFVSVERGWRNPLALVIAALLAVFSLVLVVVTLTATALSLAEQERDQATIAAVGGSGRTRRLMVASQTWLLATLGVVLGVFVGTFPGLTIARALTSEGWDPVTGMQLVRDPVIDIPLLPLAIVLIVVPALAAMLAGLCIRRTPDLTRRTQ